MGLKHPRWAWHGLVTKPRRLFQGRCQQKPASRNGTKAKYYFQLNFSYFIWLGLPPYCKTKSPWDALQLWAPLPARNGKSQRASVANPVAQCFDPNICDSDMMTCQILPAIASHAPLLWKSRITGTEETCLLALGQGRLRASRLAQGLNLVHTFENLHTYLGEQCSMQGVLFSREPLSCFAART